LPLAVKLATGAAEEITITETTTITVMATTTITVMATTTMVQVIAKIRAKTVSPFILNPLIPTNTTTRSVVVVSPTDTRSRRSMGTSLRAAIVPLSFWW